MIHEWNKINKCISNCKIGQYNVKKFKDVETFKCHHLSFYFLPKAILGNICSILDDKILVNGGLKLADAQFFYLVQNRETIKIIQFMQKSQNLLHAIVH